MQQTQLKPGNLLNSKGYLNQAGYATELIKTYNRNQIKSSKLRIKEWDYYLVYNKDFGIALTIADNGYMGLISASFLDFISGETQTVSPMLLMPLGKLDLPPSSEVGDIHFKNKQFEIHFTHEGNSRRLKLNMPKFHKQSSFYIDVMLTPTLKESIVIATPFSKKSKAFYYNQKIIGMRASGNVNYKNKYYVFNPEESFGILDWGRGVWTYNNTWYWGAANGILNGDIFGFNIGYGFGDTSSATENMLFYNGAHKLNHVTFHIPENPDGTPDYLSPWKFTSSDNRFQADFFPILDRSAYTSFGILLSDQHQVFGHFTGTVVLDSGETINFENILGFAEKVKNKW
ncbi:DUF2804 domain-containing protein [Fusibacter tunisiensis]|uniref:DUF2804 domain-containing protein n=1 Tax=Fusibacter tunisiensis TaxID=1008308 RepID=A0ABS2MUE6_9FIRM|nr:DUF2804 domain-containing protein [Fusibacter tunisiensis]MBM7563032.1 hypothetical protein [Fusibacter tunisiensis]